MDKRFIEAREAGRKAFEDGQVPLYDIGGHMTKLGIEPDLQGAWMAGLEDGMEEQGLDVEGDVGDGYDWERQALARAV